MMLASIVLPRPTSSARMARPLMWRSTRWATSIWCGSALIAFASSVISRSKPGTRAIRSASRRSSCQSRSVGGAWSRFANASRECSSTDQTSSAGGVGRGRAVGDSGIDTQRVARGPQYTSYQLAVLGPSGTALKYFYMKIMLLMDILGLSVDSPGRPIGGGGGNRTRVRKSSAVRPTYLAWSFGSRLAPVGRQADAQPVASTDARGQATKPRTGADVNDAALRLGSLAHQQTSAASSRY